MTVTRERCVECDSTDPQCPNLVLAQRALAGLPAVRGSVIDREVRSKLRAIVRKHSDYMATSSFCYLCGVKADHRTRRHW